jgi:dolichol-phosphate mannosyltransferase
VSALDLAVVIPAWNEGENLELLLPALREVLDDLGVGAEIVVVDGGSTDGTRAAAIRRGARVVVQTERGYGGALLAGFAATTAPWIVTMDADLSHRPVFLHELWKRRHEAEVLIASRYVPGGRAEMHGLRRALSHALNRTYARVLALPLRDLSSGFRMYRRDVVGDARPEARDFDVLEELLIRAQANGWRVTEVPFHYMARGSGRSHARLVKFGWALARTLGRMWRLRNSVDAADYDWRAYDSRIWPQRYRQRVRHRIVGGWVSAGPVVHVGWGSSRMVADLPASVAVDRRLNKLRWLHQRHPRLAQAGGDRLPFRDATLGTLVTSDVDDEHVREAARVLRPGGTLIADTPDYGRRLSWAVEWLHDTIVSGAGAARRPTRHTRASLTASLTRHRFDVLDVRYVAGCDMIVRARRRA